MARVCRLLVSCALIAAAPVIARAQPPFPAAVLQAGSICVRVYLPDAKHGFYRGTRFDWSGMCLAACGARSYFTLYKNATFPEINHAAGPAEEFDKFGDGTLPPGYDDAHPGALFLKIGVGWLRKDAGSYLSFRPYTLVDPGLWLVRRRAHAIDFTQRLPTHNGYGCLYRKQLSIDPPSRTLVVRHWLTNTASRVIATTVYSHNFVALDGRPVQSGETVSSAPPLHTSLAGTVQPTTEGFLFHSVPKQPLQAQLAAAKSLRHGMTATISNPATGTGVRIGIRHPLMKCALYAEPGILCIEPYLRLSVAPGRTVAWETRYTFQPDPKTVSSRAAHQ